MKHLLKNIFRRFFKEAVSLLSTFKGRGLTYFVFNIEGGLPIFSTSKGEGATFPPTSKGEGGVRLTFQHLMRGVRDMAHSKAFMILHILVEQKSKIFCF